jgi:hypothetical protein
MLLPCPLPAHLHFHRQIPFFHSHSHSPPPSSTTSAAAAAADTEGRPAVGDTRRQGWEGIAVQGGTAAGAGAGGTDFRSYRRTEEAERECMVRPRTEGRSDRQG